MKTEIDYKCLDEINGFEFGLILHKEELQPFEVVVIHHEACMVRTIECTNDLNSALEIAKQSIQKGFKKDGLFFHGVAQYQLPVSDYTYLSMIL